MLIYIKWKLYGNLRGFGYSNYRKVNIMLLYINWKLINFYFNFRIAYALRFSNQETLVNFLKKQRDNSIKNGILDGLIFFSS